MAPDIRLQNGRLLASIKNSARLELRRCDAPIKNGGMKKWWDLFKMVELFCSVCGGSTFRVMKANARQHWVSRDLNIAPRLFIGKNLPQFCRGSDLLMSPPGSIKSK